MAYRIAGVYDFDGPFISPHSLKEDSGVYVILDLQSDGYHLLDSGGAENVREQVMTHGRKACWEENRRGTIHYAAYYGDESARKRMERIVRENYDIPCGGK